MPAFSTLPTSYWISVYILCWVILWLAVRWPLSHLKISNPAFVLLALGLLFLLRLPTIVYDQEINPDESQMIAQAMTLRQDPVYFRSVDGTTGGPLDSYLLVVPSFFGLPFDYITAHSMAYVLVSISLLLLFATACAWFGSEAARLALLPVVFMLGMTQNGDLLHYNSELVAIALLSGSYYCLSVVFRQSKPSAYSLALIGLLLGMVPFGKLQGVPLAATVGLFAVLAVLQKQSLLPVQKMTRLGALFAGAASFPVLFVLFVWLTGVYDDFFTFYILGNFQYAGDSSLFQNILDLPQFFRKGDQFDWFVKLVLGVWLIWLVLAAARRRFRTETQSLILLGFLVTLTLSSLYAISRTGSAYVHYLYFLIGSLVLWLAYGFNALRSLWTTSQIRTWLPAGLVASFLLYFLIDTQQNGAWDKDLNHYSSEYQNGWRMPLSQVAQKVHEYAKPGEKLAVWGWRCDYYVQTGMPQGVAENHTIRSVFDHPLRDVYQRRYINNIVRSFPPVFIDAVGHNDLWLTDRKTQGHEVYPPLGRFIAAHYRYVGLVDDARIYVRYDRVNKHPDGSDDKTPLLVESNHVD